MRSKVQPKSLLRESNKHKSYGQPFHAIDSKRINGCYSNSNHGNTYYIKYYSKWSSLSNALKNANKALYCEEVLGISNIQVVIFDAVGLYACSPEGM